MLGRQAAEFQRSTSAVKYELESFFETHTHNPDEEFLVLDGLFSDEMGDFGHGIYVWNPIGSSHQSHSKDGCTILLKLSQKVADDTEFVWIDTHKIALHQGMVDGLSVMPLHSFGTEGIAFGRMSTGYSIYRAFAFQWQRGLFHWWCIWKWTRVIYKRLINQKLPRQPSCSL